VNSFKSTTHPIIPVLICGLLWGSAFPVIKQVFLHWEDQGLQRTLPIVYFFAGVRFCISGTGLLIYGKNLRQEFRQTSLKALVFLALTQTLVQYLCFYQAVALSSASLASLLVATGSFWWMLLTPAILKTPWPNQSQWLGLIVGGVGVTLAVYAPGEGGENPIAGALLMLMASCSGALAVIVFQKIKQTMTAVNSTGISLLSGGAGLLIIGAGAMQHADVMFDTRVILSTLWLAFVSAAAFSLWNYLTTLYPVTLLASYRFLIPICGVVESLLFLKTESPGWGLLVGGVMVLASVIFAQKSTIR